MAMYTLHGNVFHYPTTYSNNKKLPGNKFMVRPCHPIYFKYLIDTLLGNLDEIRPDDLDDTSTPSTPKSVPQCDREPVKAF